MEGVSGREFVSGGTHEEDELELVFGGLTEVVRELLEMLGVDMVRMWMLLTELDWDLLACHEPQSAFPDARSRRLPQSTEKPKQY